MENVSLHDIEGIAQLESAKMQHFYIGVEHLFIALTKLDGGLTGDVFENGGQSARYLRFATREVSGRGDDRRYWSGYRTTPRAAAVLERAHALNEGGIEPAERALFLAILEEGDSLPMRVMREAGVDVEGLRETVEQWTGGSGAQGPMARITGGEDLPEDVKVVLRKMFQKYQSVQIEHVFQEGFSGSTVMLVRPMQGDGRADAMVVVKIADRQAILWEKKRYDTFVRDTLPPTTARIEADPILPERSQLGGLKYTFVRLRGEDMPVSLREFAQNYDGSSIARFLRDSLYDGFREAWWGQAKRTRIKEYRFSVWQEYEFLLPPALIVDAINGDEAQPSLGRILRPLEDWSRNSSVRVGELVELENFTAQKVKRSVGTLQIAAGAAPESVNRASQIELHGVDFTDKSYYRGEQIRRLVGRVVRTREDVLQEQIHGLAPNFNILDDYLPYTSGQGERLPNPLRRYNRMLDLRLTGTLSTIHGDLHVGNVLIGPGGDAWLIDFEWARDGHTLFDWATLETSLLIDHVYMSLGTEWEDVWPAIEMLDQINRHGSLDEADRSPLADVMRPLVEVRSIVSELLMDADKWSEYHIALSLCALRVLGWTARPLAARRLAFLASALAMGAADSRDRSRSRGDLTDVTTDLI